MRHTKPSTFADQIGRRPPNYIDRTGLAYGHWTVIERDPKLADHWLCRNLNTGNVESLSTQALRSRKERHMAKLRRTVR
jgi:hypothetical protein